MFLPVALLLVGALLLAACTRADDGTDGAVPSNATGPVRFLSIEGDVERSIIRNTGVPVKNDAALPDDEDFEGTPLADFIAEAGISGTPQTIYFASSGDGFVSSIDYADAERVYVIFSAWKGWCIVAPDHPPGASGVDIDHIIIVSEGSKVGLSVIDRDGDATLIPMGRLLTVPQRVEFRFDGRSINDDGDGERAVALYTRQYSIALADIDEGYRGVPFVVVTRDGQTYLTNGEGRFILNRQTISYVETTGDIYEGVVEIRLR
jgi:hypothetical protein